MQFENIEELGYPLGFSTIDFCAEEYWDKVEIENFFSNNSNIQVHGFLADPSFIKLMEDDLSK